MEVSRLRAQSFWCDKNDISKYVAGVWTAFIYVWLGMLMKYVLCVFEHVHVGVGHVRAACAGG